MTIPLDVITRKKLILVRQLYQRAVLLTAAQHSYVDRIMALIGFDLTIETVLKSVVGSLNSAVTPKGDFQSILQQADAELLRNGLPPVPDKANIQHVRTLRNDSQHKAKYPNETDVNDCRTYARDFLKQLVMDVWGQDFESFSLTDIISNAKVKQYLVDAETELALQHYTEAVIKAQAGFGWATSKIKTSIVGTLPYGVSSISTGDASRNQRESRDLFENFKHMRDLTMLSVIGLDYPGYLRYRNITSSMNIAFFQDGEYRAAITGAGPDRAGAEFAVAYAINAVIQIESLVGDIDKPFEL